MAIIDTDIHFHLSSSSCCADPELSLGGRISTHAIISAASTELFSDLSGVYAAGGRTEYRCFYIQNANATLPWYAPYPWIRTNTPAAGSTVYVGLDPSGVNSTAATIADPTCAPAGVSFSQPTSAAPLTVANVPAGQHFAMWVKRLASAGCTSFSTDSFILGFEGGTDA